MKKNYRYSILNEESFQVVKHPSEESRFILALISALIISVLTFLFTIQTMGALLGIIAISLIASWLAMELTVTRLLGNNIKVTTDSFPEVYHIYEALKTEMNIKKEVSIFIVQEGGVNGFIAKYLNRRFILLHSELVEGMKSGEQELLEMEWIIGRFLGAIKAKHFRFGLYHILIDDAQFTFFLNFLIKPYERAIQYTGDNIGLLANKNLEASLNALNKITIGNKLSSDVKIETVLIQAQWLSKRTFFRLLGKAYSSHPYLVRRYLNILGFAKREFPDQFRKYVDKLDPYYRRILSREIVIY